MLCEEAQYIIDEAEKGELDEQLFAEAKQHIEGCDACRQPFEELARVGELPCIIIPKKDVPAKDRFTLREEELRKENPQMFTHPDLKPGEVWLGDMIIDAVGAQIGIYHDNGIPSARAGSKPIMSKLRGSNINQKFEYRSLFANLRELIAAEQAR